VPKDHPLRVIRRITDPHWPRCRDNLPGSTRRLIDHRLERQLMERLEYHPLFRWFTGRSAIEPVWEPTVFCKNRDRLLEGDIAADFMAAMLSLLEVKRLLSSEHFSVGGTLIRAWASMKSFRRKDGTGQPPGLARNAGLSLHGAGGRGTVHDRLSSQAINFGIVSEAASFDADQCHKRTNRAWLFCY
jgi:hypothetical protein